MSGKTLQSNPSSSSYSAKVCLELIMILLNTVIDIIVRHQSERRELVVFLGTAVV